MKLKKRNILKFKNFKPIINFLKKFNLKSFGTPVKVKNYLNFFELSYLIKKSSNANLPAKKKILSQELDDLCRLHWLILSRKALTTLEYGSGFSTIFIADACFILSHYFNNMIRKIRVEKKFHIFSLEESSKFLKITKKNIPGFLSPYITLVHSRINIAKYQNKFTTTYSKIPDISPDFIYLDGPSTNLKKRFKGFSFNNISRFPMSSDLLQIEYFLEPGTFIIIDGRTANARFLKDHFKRKWNYYHDRKNDYHCFELAESPLGPHNKNKLNFCFKDKIKIFKNKKNILYL